MSIPKLAKAINRYSLTTMKNLRKLNLCAIEFCPSQSRDPYGINVVTSRVFPEFRATVVEFFWDADVGRKTISFCYLIPSDGLGYTDPPGSFPRRFYSGGHQVLRLPRDETDSSTSRTRTAPTAFGSPSGAAVISVALFCRLRSSIVQPSVEYLPRSPVNFNLEIRLLGGMLLGDSDGLTSSWIIVCRLAKRDQNP